VELVDEGDHLAVGLRDLREDRLQAFLELAPILRPRDHAGDVERDEALAPQRLRDVAVHDALGESLDDRRLADAGLTDEDRVVLRAAREDLDDATDLGVAADDRVELALPGALGEVGAVLGEGLEEPSGSGEVTGRLPRTAGTAERSASADAPALSRISRVSPVAARPSRRCSVETYSSPSAPASSVASEIAVSKAREVCGCCTEPPELWGSAASAASARWVRSARSAPTASRSASAIPPSWSSSARSRWEGSIWGLPAVVARCMAAATASCDFVVSFVSIGLLAIRFSVQEVQPISS
jgi:hypothetical protein